MSTIPLQHKIDKATKKYLGGGYIDLENSSDFNSETEEVIITDWPPITGPDAPDYYWNGDTWQTDPI